jgi:hypothetical protein
VSSTTRFSRKLAGARAYEAEKVRALGFHSWGIPQAPPYRGASRRASATSCDADAVDGHLQDFFVLMRLLVLITAFPRIVTILPWLMNG